MKPDYYSELLPVLADRAKLSAISRLGFSNVPLRRYLAEVFDRPFGELGAFLADPTFEAVFGWQKAEPTMAELAGDLLTPELSGPWMNRWQNWPRTTGLPKTSVLTRTSCRPGEY